VGLSIEVDIKLRERLENLRQWDGAKVAPEMSARVLREFERWQLIETQIRRLESQRLEALRNDQTPGVDKMRQLLMLRAIGENGAWILVREFFGWRQIRNGRELGCLAGLAPTPYDSGGTRCEQGISKAGNRRVRTLMVELGWGWLHFQPNSELSKWYQKRFGNGNSRLRKVGIVALARKLLIALWKYLETGELPEGASCKKPWLKRRLKKAC
jgi:transposase